MRLRALATTVLAAFLAIACHKTSSAVAEASAQTGHFTVILERSVTGWAAHCETGCRGTDGTTSCEGCDVQLDASGIARAFLAPAPKGFAFVVSNARDGWTARGIQGVWWQKLSLSCGAAV